MLGCLDAGEMVVLNVGSPGAVDPRINSAGVVFWCDGP
jgi:hypothetical protein